MKTIITLLLALLFSADSIFRTIRSNINFGGVLVYIITAILWIYAIFNKRIDLLTHSGVGLAIKTMFLIGCAVLACLIAFLAIKGNMYTARYDEKAVLVLGAGLRKDKVYGVLQRRLDKALEYHAQNPSALIVVSGGQGPQETVPEALAMKKYLIEHGVAEELIIAEDKSTSTEENFAFSLKMLENLGISKDDKICYISNDFHIYRAGEYAKRAGFTHAVGIGASTGIASLSSCYLREVCAVLYLWVFK